MTIESQRFGAGGCWTAWALSIAAAAAQHFLVSCVCRNWPTQVHPRGRLSFPWAHLRHSRAESSRQLLKCASTDSFVHLYFAMHRTITIIIITHH